MVYCDDMIITRQMDAGFVMKTVTFVGILLNMQFNIKAQLPHDNTNTMSCVTSND